MVPADSQSAALREGRRGSRGSAAAAAGPRLFLVSSRSPPAAEAESQRWFPVVLSPRTSLQLPPSARQGPLRLSSWRRGPLPASPAVPTVQSLAHTLTEGGRRCLTPSQGTWCRDDRHTDCERARPRPTRGGHLGLKKGTRASLGTRTQVTPEHRTGIGEPAAGTEGP